MRLTPWLIGGCLAGTGLLLYGTFVESHKLVVERRTLLLPSWPERLAGFRIALIADLHLRDVYTERLGNRAISAALDAEPDMVVIAGDFVGRWKSDSADMISRVLEPLLLMNGNVLAVPGNHDYWGDRNGIRTLARVLGSLNVRLLRNECWSHQGIDWIGIDSANEEQDDPIGAFSGAGGRDPAIVVWHEPDMVDALPRRADLMLAGHSHGGQFVFPGGFAPMHTENGKKYVRGWYPHAPTPLYVNRGLGTTGPPSRFNSIPEVTVLTLLPRAASPSVLAGNEPGDSANAPTTHIHVANSKSGATGGRSDPPKPG